MADESKIAPQRTEETEQSKPGPRRRKVGPEDEERGQQTDKQPFNRDD